MKKILLIFLIIILFITISQCKEIKKKEKIITKATMKLNKKKEKEKILKESIKTKNKIKEIETKIKPLQNWIKNNKEKWYPESVFVQTLTETIRKKRLDIIKSIKTITGLTLDKTKLYMKSMSLNSDFSKQIYLYLISKVLNNPNNEKSKKIGKYLKTITRTREFRDCKTCDNLKRTIEIINEKKIMKKQNQKIKKYQKGLNGLIKRILETGETSEIFSSLYLSIKTISKLETIIKEKTLYFQKYQKRQRKIDLYERKIDLIDSLFNKLVGKENEKERNQLRLLMKKFRKEQKNLEFDLKNRESRIIDKINSYKDLLKRVQNRYLDVQSRKFEDFLKNLK
jgi:hypothetical protein